MENKEVTKVEFYLGKEYGELEVKVSYKGYPFRRYVYDFAEETLRDDCDPEKEGILWYRRDEEMCLRSLMGRLIHYRSSVSMEDGQDLSWILSWWHASQGKLYAYDPGSREVYVLYVMSAGHLDNEMTIRDMRNYPRAMRIIVDRPWETDWDNVAKAVLGWLDVQFGHRRYFLLTDMPSALYANESPDGISICGNVSFCVDVSACSNAGFYVHGKTFLGGFIDENYIGKYPWSSADRSDPAD